MVRSPSANGPGERPAVILTGGEHLSVLGAVRALDAAGYAPWVAAHVRGAFAARSRSAAGLIEVPRPWEDADGFVSRIADAAARIRAAAIVPGTEFAMTTLAQRASDLPPDAVLAAPTPATIAAATDKGRLGELARASGLSVPPTVDISLTTMTEQLPFDYPVVVKPHRSEFRGADGAVRHHGAGYAGSGEELRAALATLPGERGLVQPFLRGPLTSLAGVFWGDRMVCAIQSSADRVWPVPCGSFSHAVTVPLDRALSHAVARLMRSAGWQGLFQVDLFERSHEHLVIDLNPRLYTSLAHATRAGFNLPGIWMDLLLGREPHVPTSYRVGVHYRNEAGDVRALARMLIHGPRMAAMRGLVPHRDTALAIFAAHDPWPLMTSLTHVVRRRTRTRRDRKGQPMLGGKGGAAV